MLPTEIGANLASPKLLPEAHLDIRRIAAKAPCEFGLD